MDKVFLSYEWYGQVFLFREAVADEVPVGLMT